MSKQPRLPPAKNVPMHWKPWTLKQARAAGQLEIGVWRSTDPRADAARAEKAEERRQRRRRRRMGVFT
jgi:hypothetical protein